MNFRVLLVPLLLPVLLMGCAEGTTERLCEHIESRDWDAVENSLKAGADINGTCSSEIRYSCDGSTGTRINNHGLQPLALAIDNVGSKYSCTNEIRRMGDSDTESISIVALLLQYRPQLNQTFQHEFGRQTLLSLAAQRGAYDIFNRLLEAGADPNLEAESGNASSGLQALIQYGYRTAPLNVFESILNRGADINSEFYNLVLIPEYILSEPREDIARLIIQKKIIRYCAQTRNHYTGQFGRVIDFVHPKYQSLVNSYWDGRCN